MSARTRLERLAALTETVLAARQSEFAALRLREGDLRRRLSDLSAEERQRAAHLQGGPDAALLAGVDLRWQTWIATRRADLATELAQTLSRIEDAKSALGEAFGRDHAVSRLLEKARDQAKKRRA